MYADMCFLSDNIYDYFNVSQGKVTVPSIDDGEEFQLADVSGRQTHTKPTKHNQTALHPTQPTQTYRHTPRIYMHPLSVTSERQGKPTNRWAIPTNHHTQTQTDIFLCVLWFSFLSMCFFFVVTQVPFPNPVPRNGAHRVIMMEWRMKQPLPEKKASHGCCDCVFICTCT